jgi:signal transduction histidine kinase
MEKPAMHSINGHGSHGRRRLRSLRTKFVLFISLIIVVICSGLSWYFIQEQTRSMSEALLHTGTILVKNLAHNSRYSLITEDTPSLQRLADGTMDGEEVVYAVMTGPDGKSLITRSKGSLTERGTQTRSRSHPLYPNPAYAKAVFESVSSEATVTRFTMPDGEVVYDFAAPVRRRSQPELFSETFSLESQETLQGPESSVQSPAAVYGVVQIGLTSSKMQQSLDTVIGNVALTTLLIILAGIGATTLLANRIVSPLRSLSTVAQRVADGDLTASVEPTTRDEVGQLAGIFNNMTRSLRERDQAISSAYQELEQLAQTLERRVLERTQELQLANQKLQELDRLKSAFVSIVSHELRTPMTSIKGYVENMLIGLTGTLTDKQSHYLQRVKRNVERLTRLINDLLDLSRIEAGRIELHPAWLSVPELVGDVVESLHSMAREKPVTVVTQSAPALPLIRADRDKLHQILTNLIQNAIKFTPPNGEVRVEMQRTDGHVLISVADTGCGIPPDEIDKVFEKFYRGESAPVEARGAGLGLAITKSLVELHGGRIWVESTPGHGSRFSLTLPTELSET